jgi:hypothetical protein
LRSIDRKINEARYPYLFYPEVYLLDAGYRAFYAEHPECCDGKYTEMRNLQQSGGIDLNGGTTTTNICEEALHSSRKNWKRHKSTDFSNSIDSTNGKRSRSSSSF